MLEYIKNAAENSKKRSKERYVFDDTFVLIKDQLPYGIDIDNVLNSVNLLVPKHLTKNLDVIYIGGFKEFDERKVNAFYKDGALYITNDQENENDMIDDIVHEIAHAAKARFAEELYADGLLENEFLGKRKKLYFLLRGEGFDRPLEEFLKTEFQEDLDNYLYEIVGYPLLANLTANLFYSPYAATSFDEYYANGFENYFIRDRKHLKDISPMLYNKIKNIAEIEEI